MKKVIKLTEAELTDLIKRVIQEQQSTISLPKTTGGKYQTKVSPSKEYNMIDTCASMGIKTPGYCDTQAKKPVKSCADLGVKTPGYCYVDTKKPVPNMAPKSGKSIQEATMGIEPILDKKGKVFGTFLFDEGKTKPSSFNGGPVTQAGIDYLIKELAGYIKSTGTLKTLQDFGVNKVGVPKNAAIPKFITLAIGTSHTGSGETNSSVAQGRYNFLAGMVMKAFDLLGVDSAIAKSVVITNSDSAYRPSNLDKNFFDPKKMKPEDVERYGAITVTPLVTKGNDVRGIQGIQGELNSASSIINTGFLDFVDEDRIVKALLGLETFSDIKDLDDAIAAQRDSRFNGLESFINTQLFDDKDAMRLIASHFIDLAKASGKQSDTVRMIGDKISIGLGA